MGKYKVGTSVRDIAPGFEGKRGVVVSEDVPGASLVKWKDGKIVRELDKYLVVDNSALNAKFKVGDEVDVVGTRMRNKIVSKVLFDNGVSSEYELKGVPMVRYQESMLTPALNPRNSCASTNPVVANALAARNAKDADGKELKVGDKIKVQVDMHGRWDGGGVVTALKPYRIVEYKDVFGHVNTTQENSVRKA